MPYGKDSAITSGGYGKDAPVTAAPKSDIGPQQYTPFSGETWPVDLSASDVGEIAKGIIPGAAGIYGDIASLARTGVEKLGIPKTAAEFLTPAATVLPTTSQIESVFGKPSSERAAGYRQIGELSGSMISPEAAVSAAKPAVKGAEEVADVIGKALPRSGTKAIEAVKTIGPATDESVLGEKMSKTLTDRFKSLWAKRSAEEKELRESYLARENKAPFLGQQIVKNYNQKLSDINPRSLHSDQAKILATTKAELANKPTLEKIITERRNLDDIANSGELKGYSAVTKIMAGRLRDALTESIEELVPEYREYLDVYRHKSGPINLFTETTFGKRAITEASDKLPDEVLKYNPSILPKTFFKDKQTVNNLRAITGGDEKFVENSAREYAASQLNKLTRDKRVGDAASAARQWLNDNKIWLDELPSVEADVESRVAELDKTATVHRVRNYAGLGLMGALGVGGVEYALRRGLGF